MYFDLRNHYFSSARFHFLSTSDGAVDEWLAFGNEFRRKHQRADCEILAVLRDHCLRYFGNSNEEGVFRSVFLAQSQWLRRHMSLFGLCSFSGRLDPDLAHHACPERWCSLAEGPLSNSSSDALSHSRSETRR